jgi:hypothetical protein
VWSEATGWVYETQEEIDDSLAMESAVALTRAAHSSDAAGRALRRTLRQDSRISYFAWVGLGLQGDTGVVVLALEELPKARRHGDGPRTYLEHLPGETTLPIARDLIKRSDEACASMGWQLLAAHGSAADMPVLHAELLRVLAEDDWDDVRTVLRGFIGNLKSGPYPAVQTCFERMPDSQDRERAAWILLFGSPDGADDLAFECLWDCEEETRELAAGVIARKTQEIRERVEAIQTLVSAREHARTSALRARLRAAELPVDRTD